MRPRPQTILTHNVAALLDDQGLSFAALGRLLGWSEHDIAALSAGSLDATLDQLDALAELLGALPVDFMQEPVRVERRLAYMP